MPVTMGGPQQYGKDAKTFMNASVCEIFQLQSSHKNDFPNINTVVPIPNPTVCSTHYILLWSDYTSITLYPTFLPSLPPHRSFMMET